MVAQDISDLAAEAALWTSPQQPVVCWPMHCDDSGGSWRAFHAHPDLEATVVLEGVQDLRYADAQLECRPGDVWFAAPGEIHGYRTRAVTNICLAFSPAFLGDAMLGDWHWLVIFAHPPARRPKVKLAEQRSNVLSTGWQMYQEVATRRPGWEDALRIHLLQVLLSVAREWSPDQRTDAGSGGLSALLPALYVVCRRSKLGEKVSVAEAARACALSRSHFSRVFRKLMGRSFGQFETQSRLAVAAALLRVTQLPIKDIAVRAGFWDASHLDHHFAAHHGTTPRSYRRESTRRRHTEPARADAGPAVRRGS